jgi:hypothetical protein
LSALIVLAPAATASVKALHPHVVHTLVLLATRNWQRLQILKVSFIGLGIPSD